MGLCTKSQMRATERGGKRNGRETRLRLPVTELKSRRTDQDDFEKPTSRLLVFIYSEKAVTCCMSLSKHGNRYRCFNGVLIYLTLMRRAFIGESARHEWHVLL